MSTPQPVNTAPVAPVIYQSRERVLIFDMNNEYGEFGIKTMLPEHIEAFNVHPIKEIRRIVPFRKDAKTGRVVKLKPGEMISLLEIVVDKYRGGKLIIEDPSKFMGRNMTDDIIGAICTNRHNSVDVVMHYQSINRPLPVIHENTNIYRFHHQGDDVYKAENKLLDSTEAFKIIQILVRKVFRISRDVNHPCKRFFVYFNKDNNCIVGDFSPKQFNDALYDYIDICKSELKNYINKRDRQSGQLVYTDYAQAVEAFRKFLYETYYGNDLITYSSEREALFMVASGLKGVGKTVESMRETIEDYCGLPLPPIFKKMEDKQAAYVKAHPDALNFEKNLAA